MLNSEFPAYTVPVAVSCGDHTLSGMIRSTRPLSLQGQPHFTYVLFDGENSVSLVNTSRVTVLLP